ncbi:hypothetical protein F4775DRAFT_603464 [Biscogniauxia sp. FL1348]|nr:hypothetical protein F4775DRAFT_603464 [Biscogniauxia sp. FL1348]
MCTYTPRSPVKAGSVVIYDNIVSLSMVTDIENECTTPDTDADNECVVDWTKYEPPDGLKDVSDVHSELVAKIIQDSISNVKARIIEEERRKAEAERLKQEEEEAQKDREKGEEAKASETPIEADGPADAAVRPPSPDRSPYSYAMTKKTLKTDPPPGAESTRPKKRSLMNIFRRLNHSGEKGETSAAGASRHKPHHGSSASDDLDTHAGRRKECVSCLEDFSAVLAIQAPCRHSYCPECFRRLVAAACDNEQQWPPKCCLSAIPSATVARHADAALRQRYRARACEWSVPAGERVYCSEAACGQWVRPQQVDRAAAVATCPAGHATCALCRGRAHAGGGGAACPQDRDLARTQELADAEGWKRCPGCRAFVEHREACQHMTCRCGAEFCYVCGARWRTCGCTMEQLLALKRGADARRRDRRDRELLEEAEVQDALRLIEEYEREEALKAELRRRERERLAEERRRRELEERIRREGERRKAVEAKFRELREVFSYLHELQRLLVQRDHDREGEDARNRELAALEELQGRHKADREVLIVAANSRIRKREKRLEAEYEARVAEERRIREQYHAKLQMYWAQKKNGTEKMDEALEELRGKLDKSFGVWKKWMKDELEKYRYNVLEEQAIQEELMEAAERKLTETMHERQETFEKRKGAELRWVHAVIEERERMLADMEVDETENGEDIDAWFAEDALDDVVDVASQESDPAEQYRVPGAFEN